MSTSEQASNMSFIDPTTGKRLYDGSYDLSPRSMPLSPQERPLSKRTLPARFKEFMRQIFTDLGKQEYSSGHQMVDRKPPLD